MYLELKNMIGSNNNNYTIIKKNWYWYDGHNLFSGRDFSHKHSMSKGNRVNYHPLSRTIMGNFYNQSNEINIIISENYQNTNRFFSDNYKNFNVMFNNIIEF